MDSNKNTGRTNIIGDLDAIAFAQQGQRKTTKKSKKAGTGPAKGGSSKAGSWKKLGAGQAAGGTGSSKPRTAKKTADQTTSAQYYEQDRVKIPLIKKGGKRRTHARLTSTLRNKGTDFLLDIVQEYAGVEKRKEFKNADKAKAEIAEWIEEVEMRALGPNSRSNLKFSTGDTEDDVPMAES